MPYTYTWQRGRQLASISDGTTTWTYTYDANGMRTQRSNGTDTYRYVYNGSHLTCMTKGSDTLYFSYDADGYPFTLIHNGTTYYYIVSPYGTVDGILDSTGTLVAYYGYDAWGGLIGCKGPMADTLGVLNPLRYRSYVYDNETELYYLQSRYYDPEIGRFINADGFVSTGQGILGNNMFAYCNNNPVNFVDTEGNTTQALQGWMAGMWWLCGVDAVLPFGDLLYAAGIAVLGTIALASGVDDIPSAAFDKTDATFSAPSPNNDNDDDDDDYYDDDSNFGGKQKIGKNRGNAPRSNKAQNEQVDSITKQKRLSYKRQELLHRYINRQGYSYQEVLDELQMLEGIK